RMLVADEEIAGVPDVFGIVAKDQFQNTVRDYTGTVHLTSSDAKAVLPADLTFSTTSTAPDAGFVFFYATFETSVSLLAPGSFQTLTATDTANSSVTGTGQCYVKAGPVSSFRMLV